MLDIEMEVYYAELSWTLLMKEIKKAKVTFSEISKFPAVKRDLALLLDKSVQFSEVEKIAKDSERKTIEGSISVRRLRGQEPSGGQEVLCRKLLHAR